MRKLISTLTILFSSSFTLAQSTDVIQYSSSACYGACPAFDLMLFSDGTMIFNGLADVKTPGISRKLISNTKFAQAVELFNQASFYDLKDNYWSKEESGCKELWTDNPSKTLSIQFQGKSKRVSHYLGCRGFPNEAKLVQLESNLYSLLNLEEFVGK